MERNVIYELARQNFILLGMDRDNYSSAQWNPLGELIQPGQHVVIKPNLVRHIHMGGGDLQAVITHPSMVRCMIDYAALALRGTGRITVGDAPVQSADFAQLVAKCHLREICDAASNTWNMPIELVDFRLWSSEVESGHRIVKGKQLSGDPRGYIPVNLGDRSLLAPLGEGYARFKVTSYDCKEMQLHHNETTHEYLIPRTVLEADAVINLPKLKTHRKVGLTAALKNLVGINGHKDWLPHHREGSLKEGGDEYPNPSRLKRLQNDLIAKLDRAPCGHGGAAVQLANRVVARLIRQFAEDTYLEGSWYGNNTLWRTVLDLNRVLIYADKEGKIKDTPQRRCFTMVDAMVAGEGEGPMEPDSRKCGFLAAGVNPVAIDAVLATVVGFDYRKVPIIARAFDLSELPLTNFLAADIVVASNDRQLDQLKVGYKCDLFRFTPSSGWKGHIEQ
ncbi:MAG: DUF362 domain-containing protein [Nitrospirota bacterium]|nr:DUF362 domain-containing protein [Nitrospirota bacterium]